MDILTLIIGGLAALAGPAALVTIIVQVRKGKLSQPRAAQELVNTGLAMLEPLRARLGDAEARADRMESKLEETEAKLDGANKAVDTLTGKLRALTAAILAPDATVPKLRAMVARTTNGYPKGGE